MIPIPAIDLKGGRVVRLFQGDFDKEVVYDQAPDEMARRFEAEGAQRIHVVDLDGALKGEPKNQGLVEKILKAVKIPVELGGGIREIEQAQNYLAMGVRWVIFGTKASLDPGFLKEALGVFGEKVIVGIDVFHLPARNAQDRDFRRVHDGRKIRAADSAEIGDGKASALHFFEGRFAIARAFSHLVEFIGKIQDAF